jgi:hypothetical protein
MVQHEDAVKVIDMLLLVFFDGLRQRVTPIIEPDAAFDGLASRLILAVIAVHLDILLVFSVGKASADFCLGEHIANIVAVDGHVLGGVYANSDATVTDGLD